MSRPGTAPRTSQEAWSREREHGRCYTEEQQLNAGRLLLPYACFLLTVVLLREVVDFVHDVQQGLGPHLLVAYLLGGLIGVFE